MQIGTFANICNTKISLLRYYDKVGLLVPEYIDSFTGYRYYSEEQISVFYRITALKKAGFSISEIKIILLSVNTNDEIIKLFDDKQRELYRLLSDLYDAKKIMLGERFMLNFDFIKENDGIYAVSSRFDANGSNDFVRQMDKFLVKEHYQRISSYVVHGEPYSNDVFLKCRVVKLNDFPEFIHENTDIPFENDPDAVGKWQIIGEYAVKEDFYADILKSDDVYNTREIYFLPDGEQYWCYRWTKGKLIHVSGDSSTVNDYYLEEYNNGLYMFVNFKSYESMLGGVPVCLVLRKVDSNHYTRNEVAVKDDIDLPFVNDPRILGKWYVYDYTPSIECYDPYSKRKDRFFFTKIVFKPCGEVESLYEYGEKRIFGSNMQVWTKGFVLRKWNSTACAYEIQIIDGVEYLFIEWKSGDYTYGGMEPNYYVFKRG